MSENQVRTKVEVEGPLYIPPQYKLTKGKQKPVCKLIFPIKCTGEGDVNLKDYWLQVITFGELAKQVAGLEVGQEVICIGRISANRWVSVKDGKEKASQHIIAFRVGYRRGLSDPWVYFLGAPRKKDAEPVLPVASGNVEDEPGVEDSGEVEPGDVDESVNAFLHGSDAAGTQRQTT